MTASAAPTNGRKLATPQAVNAAIKSICDILRRSNCAGALQYVPELTWILFLRILDEKETREQREAEAVGVSFTPSLVAPYRWQDWAITNPNTGVKPHDTGGDDTKSWVDSQLLPSLRGLRDLSSATPRQKIIGEVFSGVERVRVDSNNNFCNVLDKVHEIRQSDIDTTHVFALSQIYEGLLLKMGEKNNDGGQFFTPREVIRAMVRTVAPQIGETVYDPCAGTGGFLAQAYEFLREQLEGEFTTERSDFLHSRTFYGREKENLVVPITLANLMLHGIEEPHIWHGNTLTASATYGGLFDTAPELYDVVLTNPPFGGKEGKEAQTLFPYRTSATQVLFLQHVLASLKLGGRCGIVLDEGVLFRTNETAFVQTKRKLLDECDLWCIVSLPGGVFTTAGAGVKTNLLFFTKGRPTAQVWYYDLSGLKVGKTAPLTTAHFSEFFTLLSTRADSERSWTVTREAIIAKGYDLKAVNPHVPDTSDRRTPAHLLKEIADARQELEAALVRLQLLREES